MNMKFSMGFRIGTLLTTTAAAVVAIGMSGTAQAQSPQSGTSGDLQRSGIEDIVVTARRVAENVQDIPISVGILTQKDLVARDISDFQDLKGSVVGLTTSRTGTIGGGYVTIRGLTPVATPQPASDQGVGFFVDGVAIARSQGAGAPLVDIARVEVLRGPQGTLFGRNSSIGSINFITNTPVDHFDASGSLEVGRYNAFRGEAMINIPITPDLIARFAYRHEEIDGDVKNTTTTPGHSYVQPYGSFTPAKRFDESSSNAYLAKLRYTGIAGLTLEYKYDREDVDASPGSAQLIGFNPTSPLLPLLAGIFPAQAPGNVVQSFKRLGAVNEDHTGIGFIRNDGHMLTAELELGTDLTARSITAYRRTKSGGLSDLDGATWTIPAGLFGPAAIPLCVSCSANNMDQDAWSQEAQLIGTVGAADFTLGAYYFKEHARFQNTYSVFAFVPYSPTVYTPTTTTTVPPLGTPGDQVLGNNGIYNNRSIALYGHLDYKFSDVIEASVGARYTWDNRSTDDLRPFGKGFSKLSDGRFSYDAALNFHLDDSKMFFVKYATGYTSGGIDSNIVFRPEISQQVEAGFKGEFFDRMLRLNASAYHTWVKDRQATVPNTSSGASCSPVLIAAGFTPGTCPVGLFVYNLPGTTKVKGFEVEATLNPAEGLTLTANYSYNDPKPSTGEKTRAPKENFAFSVQYNAPAYANGMYATVRFDGDYRSKYFATGGNVDAAFIGTVPAALRNGLSNADYIAALKEASISGDYWLVNARVAMADIPLGRSKLEIAGFVRNLMDTRAALFTVNLGASFHASYERPRTYGLRASFRY